MRDDRRCHALRAQAEEAKALRQFRRALRIYDALCEQAPHDPLGHHRAGEILQRLGRTTEAMRRLHRAADLYSKQGFPSKASAIYRIMLQLQPGQPELVAALQALEARRLDEAERDDRSARPCASSPFLPRPIPGRSNPPSLARPATPPLEPASAPDAAHPRQDLELIVDLSRARDLDGDQDLDHREVEHHQTAPEHNGPPGGEDPTEPLIAEDELVARLEGQLGGPHAVAVHADGGTDLGSLGLNSDEMALYRAIDGHATCEHLLVASGMPRLVALSLLLRLRDEGKIIMLRPAPLARPASA